jgi:hypothetical protein
MTRSRPLRRNWPVLVLGVIAVVLAGFLVHRTFSASTPGNPSPDSRGSVLHTFDYDAVRTDLDVVGNDRVWHGEQEPSVHHVVQTDRIRVVPPDQVPGGGGQKPAGSAMRVELRPYDRGKGDVTKTDGYAANRAEVFDRQAAKSGASPSEWPDPEGSTRWYSFSLYLQSPWQFAGKADRWLTLTQWKGARSGSPPVALELAGDSWRLGGSGGYSSLGTAETDTWVHFDVGLHFSPDPDVGWAEVWIDGANALRRTHRATLDSHKGETDPAYLKQGIYRSMRWKSTQVAYFGPLVIGTTRGSVT